MQGWQKVNISIVNRCIGFFVYAKRDARGLIRIQSELCKFACAKYVLKPPKAHGRLVWKTSIVRHLLPAL